MQAVTWFICAVWLPLALSISSSANEFPFRRPVKLTEEEFAKKLAESRKEALRLYPDLANPDSIFSRTYKLGEEITRRDNPSFFEDNWNYPLRGAESISKHLRAFSPHDPVFSEVVPVFTTKNGIVYSQMRVTKLQRDGISIVHEGGTGFIQRNDLTDPQCDKYRTSWSTEVILPEKLISKVDSAMQERDGDLNLSAFINNMKLDEMRAKAKSDLDREACDNQELGELWGLRKYVDKFKMRLFELAYIAHESGQQEAMARIEKELSEPMSEPYKSRLKELEEKLKQRDLRYKEIVLLLRGKRCQLLRDGSPVLEGIPKRGYMDGASFDIISPDHIHIKRWQKDVISQWVFKFNLKTGEAILVPEASKDEEKGVVTFHILK